MGAVTVDDFDSVRWHVARRAYGNAHATLIGLLVDWWVSRDKNRNWVLEGGPSFNPPGTGLVGRGQCDALLCADSEAVGVLEVEGASRQEYTARKLGAFFGSRDPHLSRLQFAVLLLYRFRAQGRGALRAFAPAASPKALEAVIDVSKSHPAKDIFMISLEKVCEPTVRGIRSRSEYYCASVDKIGISHYQNGTRCGEPRLLGGA